MNESEISYSEDNIEQVYLVGIKLQPGAHQADLYALVLYYEVAKNDANRPLTHDGRLVLFRSPEQAPAILDLGDSAFRKYRPFRGTVAYIYDVPSILEVLEHGTQDTAGSIADFIGELLDFVAATGWRLPEEYRDALYALADATTFSKDLVSLTPEHARKRIIDALLWCLGAVLSRSIVYR